jgi:adenine-specific DNA-methyltransferase
LGEKEYLKSTKDGDGNEIKIYKRISPVFKSISQIIKEENLTEKEAYYKYMDKIFTTAMPQSSNRLH